MRECIDEITSYIKEQFIGGKFSAAKNLLLDCVVVTQNRHCLGVLDRPSYGPFFKNFLNLCMII